jgi:L-rhamnose-H+ transport protein
LTPAAGILLALFAGILNGSFAAPTKYATRWKWENIWALWAVTGFFLVPWSIALATVPALFSVYQAAGSRALALLIAFGAGYGATVPCFGLGVEALGIALNFAIAIGISTALGSLVPLVTQHREQVFTAKGLAILAGIAVTLLGIVVCAAAGKAKERELRPSIAASSDQKTRSFGVGLTFAIVAGIGSPLVNFGLAFGDPVLKAAAAHGAGASAQSNAIWPPVLTATLIPYLIYCAYLWRTNRSFGLFFARGTASHWLLGALMGGLWMGSLALYGAASASMAGMGPVLGWPLFMSAIIITSNVWGFATGEWRGVRRNTLTVMGAGMLLLIAGFCTLAWASTIA